jgi:hypothetical protein
MQDNKQKELFQPQLYYHPKWYNFKETDLGRIYRTIPWDQLAECLPAENRGPGAPRWFSAQGMFGLMFLKAYLHISDEMLIRRFNTDWSLQLFCGKLLGDNEKIRDKAIVSRIRSYMAQHAEWEEVQSILIDYWKRDMNQTHVLLMDATCYESFIRFPTDVKLLWECCQWVFEKQIFKRCRVRGLVRPRSRYIEQRQRQGVYDRRRKKTYQQGQKRKRALLYLLDKGLGQLQTILDHHPDIPLNPVERQYLRTIKKVLEQQTFLMTHPARELKDRIVSLPRPYIRPIVRGKENKPVEFGMKVHMLQVDGLCIIDKMDFNAFNESTRLKLSVIKHKTMFGSCHQLGADKIYATNSNRNYLSEKEIFHSFPRKGPRIKRPQEDKLKKILGTVRSTIMEGSFATHKQHYGLSKVKAKGQSREIIWVLFGVMTSNAVLVSKRARCQVQDSLRAVA